jgi:hypothetical protein
MRCIGQIDATFANRAPPSARQRRRERAKKIKVYLTTLF